MLGVTTFAKAPSKLNACPTFPAAKVAPPCSVPLLLPFESFALFSARHQSAKFAGWLRQPAGGAAGLHLPSVLALKIDWISEAASARLYNVTSSSWPAKRPPSGRRE